MGAEGSEVVYRDDDGTEYYFDESQGLYYYWDLHSSQYVYWEDNIPAEPVIEQDPLPDSSPLPSTSAQSGAKSKKKNRIDPRFIPRPVLETNIQPYYTSSGIVPPSPSVDFTVIAEENCSPVFIRPTLWQIPADQDLVSQSGIGIGFIVQPLAPSAIPLASCGLEDGPLRCGRCGSYINPFDVFIDAGERYQCSLCQKVNEVPKEYQCNLDSNGQRRDRMERPELHCGSVDYEVPTYAMRDSSVCRYLFVIDVSQGAVVSGLLQATVQAISNTLPYISPESEIGMIAFDSSIYFFNRKQSLHVVSNVEDPFLPIPPEELFSPIADSHFETLAYIEEHFYGNECKEVAFGAAMSVAADALFSSGGKVVVTLSSRCNTGAGCLDDREDISVVGTDEETRLFGPQSSYYQLLSTRMAESHIGVDLFVAPNSYVDIATKSSLCRDTGGQVFLYSGFYIDKDGYSLECDMFRSLTRETMREAIMILRCASGLRVVDQYGNYFRRNPGEMDMPLVDCDKCFAIRVEHDDKLTSGSQACFQVAMVYTTPGGIRRVRVHSIQLLVTSSLNQVFKHADVDALVNISLRQVVAMSHKSSIISSRDSIRKAIIEILHVYRKRCASSTSSGQLILPEALKLLPLYTLGLLKHSVMADFTSVDERMFLFSFVDFIPLSVSISFCAPRLYDLTSLPEDSCFWLDDGSMLLPPVEIVSKDYLKPGNVYLLDNGLSLSIWVGSEVKPSTLVSLFGFDSLDGVDLDQIIIYPDENDPASISTKTFNLLERLRFNRPMFCPCRVHTECYKGTLDYTNFINSLFEDPVEFPVGQKSLGSDPDYMSYVDFLCFIHRKIQDRFL